MKRYSLLENSRQRPPQARTTMLAGLAVAAVVLSACSQDAASKKGDTMVSGNIEVTTAQLSFKIPGRLAERKVSEGDRVVANQPIGRLDDVDQNQQLVLRHAELAAAEAGLADLEAGSRPQEIASAEASVRSAEAERDRSKLEFNRQKELREKEAIADREFEAADAQLRVAEAHVADAAERLKLVKEGPRIETIRQARARVDQAKASVAVAETQMENAKLVSPLSGVVLSHNVEPGEYVSPGTPVVTVADLSHPWVRAYINENDLGKIRHGQKVSVRTDSFPGKTYEGVIGFIASDAEFTPKIVQTTKERVKLVFRIKVDVANPNDELKPGMAADVILSTTN